MAADALPRICGFFFPACWQTRSGRT